MDDPPEHEASGVSRERPILSTEQRKQGQEPRQQIELPGTVRENARLGLLRTLHRIASQTARNPSLIESGAGQSSAASRSAANVSLGSPTDHGDAPVNVRSGAVAQSLLMALLPPIFCVRGVAAALSTSWNDGAEAYFRGVTYRQLRPRSAVHMPQRVDDDLERRQVLAPARVVDVVAGEARGPVVEQHR